MHFEGILVECHILEIRHLRFFQRSHCFLCLLAFLPLFQSSIGYIFDFRVVLCAYVTKNKKATQKWDAVRVFPLFLAFLLQQTHLEHAGLGQQADRTSSRRYL